MAKSKTDKVPKDIGVCTVAVLPIRALASDASEMVSQLLFGESCAILVRKRKNWAKVKCHYDGYEGWIDLKQVHQVTDKEYASYAKNAGYVSDIMGQLGNLSQPLNVLLGATLPNFDGITLKSPLGKLTYNGNAIAQENPIRFQDRFVKLALKYINAPYLWGGRSVFGIDCSGFAQVMYKLAGYSLPRDAYQQAEIGELIPFVELSKVGDLAFFVNDEGRVVHVGIMLQNQEIIHAHGRVRIDLLDHEGIYNREIKKYSHKLHVIRRILDLKAPEVKNEE